MSSFTVRELVLSGWNIFKRTPGTFIGATIFVGLTIQLLGSLFGGFFFSNNKILLVVAFLPSVFLISWILSGYSRLVLIAYDNANVLFSTLFNESLKMVVRYSFFLVFISIVAFGPGLVATPLVLGAFLDYGGSALPVFIILVHGTLLLVGIGVASMFSFTGFLLLEKNVNLTQALNESRYLTKGFRKDICLVVGVMLVSNLLIGQFTMGVGLILTVPVTCIAFAAFYKRITLVNKERVVDVLNISQTTL